MEIACNCDGCTLFFYRPIHDVTPKVVAMAVSTVITMWRILLQMFLFSIFYFS